MFLWIYGVSLFHVYSLISFNLFSQNRPGVGRGVSDGVASEAVAAGTGIVWSVGVGGHGFRYLLVVWVCLLILPKIWLGGLIPSGLRIFDKLLHERLKLLDLKSQIFAVPRDNRAIFQNAILRQSKIFIGNFYSIICLFRPLLALIRSIGVLPEKYIERIRINSFLCV